MRLIIEAIIVGILLLIVSIPVMGALQILYPNDYTGCQNLPLKSEKKYYVATIIIGVLVHLLCEYTNINKWYCKNGYACLEKKI